MNEQEARHVAECEQQLAKYRRLLLARRLFAAALGGLCILWTWMAFSDDELGSQIFLIALAVVYLCFAWEQLHKAEKNAADHDRLRDRFTKLKQLLGEADEPPGR